MSRTSKKRFMSKRMDSEFFFPEENQLIGRVLSSKGRDLLEIEDENGQTYLASMPTKFRNTIWVKRGQFVYLLPIEEGDKVKAEIQHVLDPETVLYVREHKKWPKHFEDDAMKMTRGFKRGGGGENTIDDDMMPPSGSDEEDLEDEESDNEGEEDEDVSDEDEAEFSTFNPNRAAAPNK
ncbi:unnamed protein product [Bursaphelenchus xylophilus]|uniref:Probable RNA-binding protein EIF1AD n=1 Tax=Bursaphelenchus xylophilus TaxID=6326 RepID=A0A1I7RNT4_BURXY|nr:unnamed protein product [Bursaphelenchus xylophilus]CAG9124274.1 unnamed protein product [Bursaphelenchus xylophilus]